ncbi:MAG: PRD domain-containing protein [Eubacteriales bacterium]
MDVLNELQSKFDIEDSRYQEMRCEVIKVSKILREKDIYFEGNYEIGFYSHMISLIRRLEEGEEMSYIGDDVFNQIDEDSVNIAEEVLTPLFDKHHKNVDRSEILLVAIHIQTAKSNREGGVEDGR